MPWRKHLKGNGDKKKLWFQTNRSESTEEMPALSLAPDSVSRYQFWQPLLCRLPAPFSVLFPPSSAL